MNEIVGLNIQYIYLMHVGTSFFFVTPRCYVYSCMIMLKFEVENGSVVSIIRVHSDTVPVVGGPRTPTMTMTLEEAEVLTTDNLKDHHIGKLHSMKFVLP